MLDAYVDVARESIRERPELSPLVTRAVGAYFGQVARRVIDGFWRNVGADDHEWRMCSRSAFLSFNPVGVAHEAIARSDEHPGPSGALELAPEDRALVDQRLENVPPISEDDYYRLAVRLEVLELAYETLRDDMRQNGTEDTRYEAMDYDT